MEHKPKHLGARKECECCFCERCLSTGMVKYMCPVHHGEGPIIKEK